MRVCVVLACFVLFGALLFVVSDCFGVVFGLCCFGVVVMFGFVHYVKFCCVLCLLCLFLNVLCC